jgi:hypothetical protein
VPGKVTKPKSAPAAVPAAKTAPPGVVEVTEPLENFGGSRSDDWNNVVACQVVNALWVHPETRDKQIRAALAGLSGIGPKDELEGMMAAGCTVDDRQGRRRVTGTTSSTAATPPRRWPGDARSESLFAPCALWRARSVCECRGQP